MARRAHARRALRVEDPDPKLGLHTWRRRRTRAGHRRHHRHLLGGGYGPAAAARLPRCRAPRLDRDGLDQHRPHQPGRVGTRLSRLAVAERRVRGDGGLAQHPGRGHRRRRPRRVFEQRIRVGRVLCGLWSAPVHRTSAGGARCARGQRATDGRRRGVSVGRGAVRQRPGRDRQDDHRLRQRHGDRRRRRAWIPLSRRHRHLGARAHDRLRAEPRRSQLPGRRETEARRATSSRGNSREPPEDRDGDSAAGAADGQCPDDVVGAACRRRSRLAGSAARISRTSCWQEPRPGRARSRSAPRSALAEAGSCGNS
jgi:hypothetical protein